MFSLRRTLLTLAAPALLVSASLLAGSPAVLAQAGSSAQPESPAAQTPAPGQGQITVAARIKARREQRRAAAIKDVYSHLYEIYVGSGYLRFHPGQTLQRLNEYDWNVGVSRYYTERFGVTIDTRGTYGTAFVPPNSPSNSFIFRPAISQYAGMIGPTYRFLLNPKYSVSGRILAGAGYGNFSGDLGPYKPTDVYLYPDGVSPVVSASVPLEYNVSPALGLRLAPEYVYTRYGSANQNSLGYTAGLVVRWGKQ